MDGAASLQDNTDKFILYPSINSYTFLEIANFRLSYPLSHILHVIDIIALLSYFLTFIHYASSSACRTFSHRFHNQMGIARSYSSKPGSWMPAQVDPSLDSCLLS
jgi:hypothetical protein